MLDTATEISSPACECSWSWWIRASGRAASNGVTAAVSESFTNQVKKKKTPENVTLTDHTVFSFYALQPTRAPSTYIAGIGSRRIRHLVHSALGAGLGSHPAPLAAFIVHRGYEICTTGQNGLLRPPSFDRPAFSREGERERRPNFARRAWMRQCWKSLRRSVSLG